jgi:hypothetical protein
MRLKKVLGKTENTRFGEMVALAEAYGFQLMRINGSHRIFKHPSMTELLNLQNYRGKAKAYQIRQFVDLLEKYGLDKED